MSQKNHEFQTLRRAVEQVFECDLLNKSRERNIINARMTFSYILVERGYTKVSIGKYLNKNHATIIHYTKNFSVYLQHDDYLHECYELSLEAFNKEFDPIFTMDESSLKKEVFSLRRQLRYVSCQYDEHKKQEKEQKVVDDRIKDIMKLVAERTKKGKEEYIHRKLQTWFNGVYS